ncbi:MAG: cation diffusion facilitator family transporter, partial [Anaeroplasmataceae bacterium]|nr:cation diffusion facilitator family transporter [Anaeroplasmataceae bacterium]
MFRRLFIKNYKDTGEEKVREAHGRLASVFGIVSNLILFGIKLFAGILSASVSIIADSINNLSDMGSSLITLIGFKLANAPADEEHPYGHQRIEYISGLVVSIIILFVGGSLLKTSIEKMIDYTPTTITNSVLYISIGILAISIFIKIWQAYFNYRMGKIINSVALKATSKDSLNDCISTSTLLIGNIVLLFIKDMPFSLDGLLGILVSLFILISGIKLIKETINPLIGVSTNEEFVQKILKVIKEEAIVLGYHDLVCHMYGPTKCFMTLHIEVDANQKMLVVHDAIDNLERKVKDQFGVELTIHMDPIEIDNEVTNELRKRVKETIREIHPSLSMHDFRVVRGHTHTNLIFDLVRPYKFEYSDEQLLRMLQDKFAEEETKYYFVIDFDYSFNDNKNSE